jgi:16S rRNA (guanine1207-N2)-methyltransferase
LEKRNIFHINIKGSDLEFETDKGVFSPGGADRGTLAMLEQVDFSSTDKVLDLGCGYGLVGILASKFTGACNVVMSDISDEALSLARANAMQNDAHEIQIVKSNGLDGINDRDFTLILSNPPYHVDFSVPKSFIEKGFRKLAIGGKMFMVTKRKEWYKNKFISVFGGVKIVESDGYYVFCAEKRLKIVNA